MLKLACTKSLSSFCFLLISFFCTSLGLAASDGEGMRADLPENGRVRIINRRGAVRVVTWPEQYVSVVAVFDGPAPKVSPVLIQRTEQQLLISFTQPSARQKKVQGVDLLVRVPERSRTSVITGDGGVTIEGVPLELNVLTQGGNISARLPGTADADVRAISVKGKASTSVNDASFAVKLPSANGPSGEAQVFHVRLNQGRRAVDLRSTSGNITLEGVESVAAETPRTLRPDGGIVRPIPRRIEPPVLNSDTAGPTPTGTPAPSSPEQDVDAGDVVRVDTRLVTMNISVVDRGTNRGVADLTAKDFRLFEDGTPQAVASFDASSAPFNMVLLIDLSGSTREVVRLIKDAALRFVAATRPSDRISVITFANNPIIVSPLTDDRHLLNDRINSIEEPKGSTKLYDSLKFTIDEVLRQANGGRRNAIVLMSDGLDSTLPNVKGEGSGIAYDDLRDEVREFDGVLYALWLDTEYEALSPEDVQPETVDLGHDRLKELADAGGGVFYEVEKLEDLAGAYERVVADLGTLYSIGYRPTNSVRDGKWRAIRVNILRPDAVARGKRGYYAK